MTALAASVIEKDRITSTDTDKGESKMNLNKYATWANEKTFVDTVVVFEEQSLDFSIDDSDLDEFVYQASESAFKEVWEDEDDEYWESYLD